MKRLSNWLIVGATVALVAIPIIYGQFRAEIARWHLAAASNSIALNQGSPESFVEQAVAVYPPAAKLRDYWLFRVKQALAETPEKTADELREAVAIDRSFVSLCSYAADALWSRAQFDEYVQVMKLWKDTLQAANENLTVDELNRLAYARSLVAIDLDEALADIDYVLKSRPSNYAYRDTRAWVLFQMGRPLEALDDANFAVNEISKAGVASSWMDYLTPTPELPAEYRQALEEEKELQDEAMLDQPERPTLTLQTAGESLWGTGAIIYHRAKILEALGREEEAQVDWIWLKERNLPLDGSLF